MSNHVEFGGIPQTIEQFITLHEQIAQTPEGGAAAVVVALLVYAADEALGRQCLTIVVDQDELQDGSNGYQGKQLPAQRLQFVRSQLKGREYLPRSYIQGTTPQNGYALPEPPYRIVCSSNPYSGDRETGRYKVFVACSGADSPRPVTLKRNDKGIWKVTEWSSLIIGIKSPA